MIPFHWLGGMGMFKKVVVLGLAVMAVASVAVVSAASSDPVPQNGQYYCQGPQRGCGYYQNGNVAANGNGYYGCGYYNNGQAQK